MIRLSLQKPKTIFEHSMFLNIFKMYRKRNPKWDVKHRVKGIYSHAYQNQRYFYYPSNSLCYRIKAFRINIFFALQNAWLYDVSCKVSLVVFLKFDRVNSGMTTFSYNWRAISSRGLDPSFSSKVCGGNVEVTLWVIRPNG